MSKEKQPDYVAIGKSIKRKREEMGFTQEKLAEMTGMSVAHISNVENAHTKVSLATLILIANELDSTLDELTRSSMKVLNDSPNQTDAEISERAIIEDVIFALKKSLRSNLDI